MNTTCPACGVSGKIILRIAFYHCTNCNYHWLDPAIDPDKKINFDVEVCEQEMSKEKEIDK